MEYFDNSTILEIADIAVRHGLAARRSDLMVSLPSSYTSTLPSQSIPQSQLLNDLNEMNKIRSIAAGKIPLEIWLSNASFQFNNQPDLKKYFADLAVEVARKSELTPRERLPDVDLSDEEFDTIINEKVVHTDDLLPIGYLNGAQRTGMSVARMLVTRHENGAVHKKPFGTDPSVYLGTGWVLGPKHVITNHHVINARDPGEADASDADFDLQAESTVVQFDFDTDNTAGDRQTVLKLAC